MLIKKLLTNLILCILICSNFSRTLHADSHPTLAAFYYAGAITSSWLVGEMMYSQNKNTPDAEQLDSAQKKDATLSRSDKQHIMQALWGASTLLGYTAATLKNPQNSSLQSVCTGLILSGGIATARYEWKRLKPDIQAHPLFQKFKIALKPLTSE